MMKRGNVLMAIALISFVMAGVQPRPAEAIIYLSDIGWRDENGIDPEVGIWDPSTKTGTLTTDVTEPIETTSDYITLDGKDPDSGENHSITGPDTGSGIGVLLWQRTGVTVRNLNVTQFRDGIRLDNCSDSILSGNSTCKNNSYYEPLSHGIYLISSNGNTLTGNTASENNNGYGIYLDGSSDNTLTGNIANSNSWDGIVFNDSTDNELTDNTASDNSKGISIEDSDGNTLTGNTTSNNHQDGISVSGSSNTLTGNIASGNHPGITLLGSESLHSSNNTLTRNNTDNNYSGIVIDCCDGTILSDNTASDTRSDGIWIRNSSGTTLSGNTANNSEDPLVCGIRLWDSSGSTLTGNTTSNHYRGIEVNNGDNTTLAGNTATYNGYGMYLIFCDNSTVTGNLASNNAAGITFSGDNSTLSGNTVSDNKSYGLDVSKSTATTVSDNTVSNSQWGIYLSSSNTAIIVTGNTVSNSVYYGVFLADTNDSEVYNNEFINNTTQAMVYSGTGNVFNLDSPIGGNYWSDWTSPDVDGDGFVDEPYEFTGGVDNLPWVRQYGWLGVSLNPIILSHSGWSDSSVGDWDADTKTGTLTTDVTESIVISSNAITLNGDGHSVTGTGTGTGVVLSGRTDVTVKNLNVTQFNIGIYLESSTGNTVEANTATNNGYIGIQLNESEGNTLTDNTVSDSAAGIALSNSPSNTLTGNTASNNHSGIELGGSDGNTLIGNTATNNVLDNGIGLSSSDGNTLVGNTASDNYQFGIWLYGSDGNSFTGNTASNNCYGIQLQGSSNNTLVGNTLSDNSYGGVRLRECTNNQVYNNNFIRNTPQASVASGCSDNVFNLDSPIGGNYWSDWTSPDVAPRDGFVDYPYEFDGRFDDLPWVCENGWLVEGPSWPDGSTLEAPDIGLTEVQLTWTPATDGVGVTEYEVFQDGALVATLLGDVTCQVTGLQPDTTYTFNVEACDARGNRAADGPSTTERTLTPEEAAGNLASEVADLNLQEGIDNSLDGKLGAALNALDDINEHNDVAAINSLGAFITAVEAQRGKKISEEDADALIAAAQKIIATLLGE